MAQEFSHLQGHHKAYFLRFIFFPGLLFLLFLAYVTPNLSAEESIVAKVGDTEIKGADLDEAMERYIPRGGFHADITRAQTGKYRREALDNLIEIELLFREAGKRHVKVSDEGVKEVVDENIKRFGSEKEFKAALKRSGLTMKDFREKVRKYQAVNLLLSDIVRESEPKEDEIREYFERNRAKYHRPESMRLYHILVKVEPTAPEEEWLKKKEFADQLLKRIKDGEPFEDIAYAYSDDPYKVKGGDLGFVHKGRLDPKELEDSAFSLKEGELSDVIRTIHGFHIIRGGEKRKPEALSLDEVRNRIQKELWEKRFGERKKALLDRLRKEYPVEVYVSFGDQE